MGIIINGQTDTVTAVDGTINVGGDVTIPGDLSYDNVTNIDSVGVVTARDGLHVTGGAVGIGTDNPTFLLQVQNDSESLARFRRENTGSNQGGIIVGNQSRAIKITGGNDGLIITDNTLSQERLRIDSSGSVGIGTDIPGSYDSSGRTLVISENSTLAGMTIRSSTQGAIYFADGLTGNEAYRGRIEYSHSDDALNFGTAGTGSKLTLTSGGDFGVGTASPTARLDVRRGDADGKIAEFHQSTGYGIDIGSSQSEAYIASGYAQSFIFKTDPSSGQVERLRIKSDGQININASSESIGGRVLIKHNVDYTTTDFDDDPTLYLLNDDRTTGVSEAAVVFAGRNSAGSTYRAAISGNGATGLKFYSTNDAESDDTPVMSINGSKRIGINVTSPDDPLHVKNSSANPTSIRIQTGTSSTNNGDEYSSVIFDGNGYVGAKIASHRDDGTWNDRGDLRFYSGYGNDVFTERMRIRNTGLITTPYQISFLQTGMNGTDFNNGTLKGGQSDHNVGGHYNTSTGIFTAPIAGYYQFGCGILVTASTGRLEGYIGKNGTSTVVNFNGTGTTYDGPSATCIFNLAANDNVRVSRVSGTAYASSHGQHYFWGRLLG